MSRYKLYLEAKTEHVIADDRGTKWEVNHTTRHDVQGKLRHSYHVIDPKNKHSDIALVDLSSNSKKVMWMNTQEKYRKRGIMTKLLKYIENDLGYKLDENWAMTPDGEAVWKKHKSEE